MGEEKVNMVVLGSGILSAGLGCVAPRSVLAVVMIKGQQCL